MKCITVKQPWATLIVNGATQYLIRSWRTFHRGPLGVQASGKLPRSNVELCCDRAMRSILQGFGYDYAMELPTQALLGTVAIADCLQITEENMIFFDPEDPAMVFGLIQPGSWAWVCGKQQAFRQPVPMAGRLGIYNIPQGLVSEQW